MTRDISQLKNQQHFCVAPWIHLFVSPNGDLQPCCIWDYSVYDQDRERFDNIKNSNTIQEVMNVDEFRRLRQKFLNNEYEEGCGRCYDRDQTSGNRSSSMRKWMNNTFLDQHVIDRTSEDGTLTDVTLKYIDIRFSNICNLKCRMCGHGLSSTWFEEGNVLNQIKGKPPFSEKFINVDCYEMIEPYLAHVEEIYFAGGEPLLYPEHLKILNKLIELGRTDVCLKYNTNLTSLRYKGVDFVDMWKHFNHVHIGASIDGIGDAVEFIRTKLKWNDFQNNFERIRALAPHVKLTPSPTISVLNIEIFAEFEKFAIKSNWYQNHAFGLNYVMEPDWLNIYYMPNWYKQEMIKIYQDHIAWLQKRNVNGYNLEKIYELITRLQQPQTDREVQIKMEHLKTNLNLWDKTAGLNWKHSLPHVDRMLSEYDRRLM